MLGPYNIERDERHNLMRRLAVEWKSKRCSYRCGSHDEQLEPDRGRGQIPFSSSSLSKRVNIDIGHGKFSWTSTGAGKMYGSDILPSTLYDLWVTDDRRL